MGVTVATGSIYVPGTEGSSQGVYSCVIGSSTNLTVTASSPSLPRIDTVCATVRDSAYSGANNDWILQVIAGTPNASPSAPAIPADSIALANIAVAAAATQVVNANISDLRQYIGMGIIPVRNAAALPNPAYEGMYAYTLDTNIMYFYDGAAWQPNSERYKPVCNVVQQAADIQSGWTTATVTAVKFGAGSEVLDTDSAHDVTTNNSRILIGVKLGWWRIGAIYCPASNGATTSVRAVIYKNGSPIPGSFNGLPAANVFVGVPTGEMYVQATSGTDYIELMGYQAAASGTIGTSVSAPYVASSISATWERP
jgi:hypothetical protein